MTSVLEVEGLTTDIVGRGATVHAVDGVSFRVGPGETVGLVGESGCGKTITALSIMGLLPPGGRVVAGDIRLGGRDLRRGGPAAWRAARGNDVGMVFQDPLSSLNPTMTVGAQVAEGYRLHRRTSRREALARAEEVLGLVGVPRPHERLGDYPHQLSGGLRQRVMIAMALVCEPKLLIADEPTTALDVTVQAQILDLLDHLRARLGMALLLVTHDFGVIAGRADRVVVMYAGRVVEEAPTADLFARSHHPYTEALLASIPTVDQDPARRLRTIPGLPPDLTRPPAACRFAPRCAYATDVCRTDDPPLAGPEPGHPFACFHPRNLPTPGTGGPIGAPARAGAVSPGDAVSVPGGGVSVPGGGVSVPGGGGRGGGVSPGGRAAPGARGAPMVTLRHVSKDFAVHTGPPWARRRATLQAVTDVSLDVRRGETFGVVGESGCGKTTLARMVVGLEVPTSGEIRVGGQDLTALSGAAGRAFRRRLQLVFQDPYASLDPRMRVGAIVAEPLAVQRLGGRASRRSRARELLAEVGLPSSTLDRYPHELSGGQRQRVGVARAMALDPDVVVADEPVSALDVSVRSQILNLLQDLHAGRGLTLVMISHDLSVVRYLADRIGVMYLGSLVEIGTREDIFDRPAHPYTAGLLEAVPVPDPELQRGAPAVPVSGELPSPIDPPSGCRFRTRCPRATGRCAEEAPPLTPFGAEHLAACHHPLQAPSAAALAGEPTGAGQPPW